MDHKTRRHDSREGGGPRYLGPIPHPAMGIRIPEILLTGILKAYKKRNVAGGLMLSFGRETAPGRVIEAPAGEYSITMGHTGTSIEKYMTMGAEVAIQEGVVVEIEADHLIVVGSSVKAVQRIAGIHEGPRITQEELSRSIAYNKSAIDEAVSTGAVNAFTTDTSDLLNLRVENYTDTEAEEAFAASFPSNERRRLLGEYVGREFVFPHRRGRSYKYRFAQPQVTRLALKYKDSIRINQEIYDYIEERMKRPFGFEISLDETEQKTKDEEMIFYLNEWKESRRHVDFIATNIGFKKRMDFRGDLKELEAQVARHSAIAKSFGALLSIHSGSGTAPYSGKGRGTYRALLRATDGDLKYKISGIYIELLFEILASFSPGSSERNLYEEIFDGVYEYLRAQIHEGGDLASPSLRKQVERYEKQVERGTKEKRDPRSVFFRFNSYLALNLRNADGQRHFREKLVSTYNSNPNLQKSIDLEIEKLALRLIDGLEFNDNVEKLRASPRRRHT